ncbi:hypothetical protein Peur_057103 [Populus x canadensis]
MACLFSLSTRANIVRRRYNASFSYVLNDDRKHNSIDEGPPLEGMGDLFQQKPFGSSSNRFNNNNDSAVFGFFHDATVEAVAAQAPAMDEVATLNLDS